MDHLIPFIHDNALLVGAFVIILVVYMALEMRAKDAAGFALSSQAATLKMNQKKAKIIDIRPKEAFDAGHIAGAKNHPSDDFAALAETLKKHTDNPVVMICQKGIRANTAAQFLKKQKFTQVFVLKGGMDTWAKDNLPTVKGNK